MIGYLEGKVITANLKSLIISVGGVGYQVSCLPDTLLLAKVGQNINLFTHLVVREDALDLYGFNNQDELNLFEMLISVSGIGPKSAMGILSLAPATTLRQTIASGDATYLTKVSGVGRKSAEKIVLELKDKLGAFNTEKGGATGPASEAIDALEALGYSAREAREAIKRIDPTDKNASVIIKEALKNLSNH